MKDILSKIYFVEGEDEGEATYVPPIKQKSRLKCQSKLSVIIIIFNNNVL